MTRTSQTASLTSGSGAYNPWKLGGLSIMELGRRLWRESQKDELLGRAAQLSYYILLALFPALIVLTATMGLFSVQNYMPELMSYLQNVLPKDALSMVERFLHQVAEGSGANILSLGGVGALWASSSGVTAIMEALNIVYDVKEDSRPFWRVRLTAILLTIGLAGFVILSMTLILYGGPIGEWIADFVGLGAAFTWAWKVLQWPVVVALMLLAVAVVYYVCPDIEQDWRWVSPGSAFAVAMWLVVSLGFKMYVDNFGDYNKVYGSIAGVIVLMLWLYWSGLVLLIGGEINAEIEHAAAERQRAGEERQAA
ncbi:YihY/virulence factor BrkB family protein [Nitrospira moscoviensis]|uniref:Ribonuclease BN n=1 Tax=Nitrospira moscoviensis TaxID=42253 RepID=A0A0K2GE29_NITMO|nr:YihY/virulence factor BrkB family protein [Nitrospira moscoviensis]ALA59203.1 Ribonuclease BN [Nitrospira moscoviensis]